ncbi:MAG TPA: rhodanese-like domain-containing protein [Thermomicrobiales bacterium]|nr:rhodanese-like domain-containing protein [Thermomicrobiales bacterium]
MTANAITDLLVSVDWLAEHHDDANLLIVDVRPEDQYAQGHIPGAVSLDLYPIKILGSDPEKIEGWVREIEHAFRQIGIDRERHVVFYEDISGTTAARGVWLMHALSIGEGAMLDGGLRAWLAAGNEISTEPVTASQSDVTATLDPALFATADDVLSASNDDTDTTIIDTRADLEWMQGTIPGARHVEWIHHLNRDGTIKPIDELRALYTDMGLAPDDDAITFCASGYRAAHTWLVLRMLGHDRVQNYAPSWGEWGLRDDLPVTSTQ